MNHLVLLILLAFTLTSHAVSEWGYDSRNSRYARDSSITLSNVASLERVWEYTTEGDVMVSATTATVGGNEIVFFPDYQGFIHALYQSTGALLWKQKVSSVTGITNSWTRTAPTHYNGKVYFGDQVSGFFFALNATTGELVWRVVLDSHPQTKLTMSPTIYNGVIYMGTASSEEGARSTDPEYVCCTFQGAMLAINADSGRILWKTKTTPDNNGSPYGFSGAPLWGSAPPVDSARGLVFAATGNNYNVPQNYRDCLYNTSIPNKKVCQNDQNHANSIIAFSMRTGAIVWARQTGGPDVWTTECFKAENDCIDNYDVDYDFGQAPMMFTASGIDVVGVGQKSGFFYALNRGNGAIVWSKSTGPGNSGGGIIWGSAVDNSKVYIGNVNAGRDTFKFKSGESCSGGFWTALNKNTGATVWQTCDPIASPTYVASVDHPIPTLQTGRNLAYYAQAFGPVTVTPGGVLFGGSLDPRGTIYGFNVADGSIVWTDFVGGSIGSGACLTGRYLFQGGGYSKWNKGISSNKFVAFALPSSVTTTVAPEACWTCPPGDVHWYDIDGMEQPFGDPCACVSQDPVHDCWTCPSGQFHWWEFEGMEQPYDVCTCVDPVDRCWTCPPGWIHYWNNGMSAPTNNDPCQCVRPTRSNVLAYRM